MDDLVIPRPDDFASLADEEAQDVRAAVLEKLAADSARYLSEYSARFENVLNADDAATLFEEYNGDQARYRVAYIRLRRGSGMNCFGVRWRRHPVAAEPAWFSPRAAMPVARPRLSGSLWPNAGRTSCSIPLSAIAHTREIWWNWFSRQAGRLQCCAWSDRWAMLYCQCWSEAGVRVV
jgi:hypothetical protein